MSSLKVNSTIMIDEIENVLQAIFDCCGRTVKDPAIIAKYINDQEATCFYMDSKLNSKMQPDSETVFVWADTGFKDCNGNPIFISMRRQGDAFSGHYTGTAKALAKSIEKQYSKNKSYIQKNIERFNDKYKAKSAIRRIASIGSEDRYFIERCNAPESATGTLASLLMGLDISYEEEVTEDVTESVNEAEQPLVQAQTMDFSFTEAEKEITVSLLLDKLDEARAYIAELLATIDDLGKDNAERGSQIEELKAKNREYERSLVSIRQFRQFEEEKENREADGTINGHNLLGRHNKILVIGGTQIGIDSMRGIAADDYGFDNSDLEFEVDYDKASKMAGRITNNGRYAAVIIGAVPHSVERRGNDTSLVTKLKNDPDAPFAADARSESGKQKITKQSYRRALNEICRFLMQKAS